MNIFLLIIFLAIFLYWWDDSLKEKLTNNKISNFQFEKNYAHSEKKSFFTKLFNFQDKRYLILIAMNIIFYQIFWSMDTAGYDFYIPIRYPLSFPIFWYIIFQSAPAYIGYQSKKVVGREKILWIVGSAFLPFIIFPIFLFLKRNTTIEESQLENEDYWSNFVIVTVSILSAGYFLF